MLDLNTLNSSQNMIKLCHTFINMEITRYVIDCDFGAKAQLDDRIGKQVTALVWTVLARPGRKFDQGELRPAVSRTDAPDPTGKRFILETLGKSDQFGWGQGPAWQHEPIQIELARERPKCREDVRQRRIDDEQIAQVDTLLSAKVDETDEDTRILGVADDLDAMELIVAESGERQGTTTNVSRVRSSAGSSQMPRNLVDSRGHIRQIGRRKLGVNFQQEALLFDVRHVRRTIGTNNSKSSNFELYHYSRKGAMYWSEYFLYSVKSANFKICTETFNSLKRNLQNKWELVTMQAEEQFVEWSTLAINASIVRNRIGGKDSAPEGGGGRKTRSRTLRYCKVILLLWQDGKDEKSMEECNKQFSDDELLTLSEGNLSKPGTSLTMCKASLEKFPSNEENRCIKAIASNESPQDIAAKMSNCCLKESTIEPESGSVENLKELMPITIPTIETSAPASAEEETTGISDITIIESTIPEEQPTASAEPIQDGSPAVAPSTSPEVVPSTSADPKPSSLSETPSRMRRPPKKTRILSEEGYSRPSSSVKFETNKQISVDLVCSIGSSSSISGSQSHLSQSQESTELEAAGRASSVELVPDEGQEGQPHQSRTDICPWEDE
ncbi:unnamed protein product [Nesidiocoris tenuis]|uniref:Uncharacterized protein n=1 Tax=Nesidiocoris tenuis TaxID=355587 RepID=A0A6H5G0L7_9HEMI|nr:unnamed protein product [Nesidiocoris tenuis]